MNDKLFALQTQHYVDAYLRASAERPLPSYTQADMEYTLAWHKYYAGKPVLVNKLRPKTQQIVLTLNDLIHTDTLAAMTRPLRPYARPFHHLYYTHWSPEWVDC